MEKFSKIFLILGIFTTPFYIFSSGSLQPSHFFLLLFVFFFLIYKKGFYVDRKLFLLTMPFFVYVLIVNLVYSLYYQDTSFFSYPLDLTFDLLIMFSLVSFLNNENINLNGFPTYTPRIRRNTSSRPINAKTASTEGVCVLPQTATRNGIPSCPILMPCSAQNGLNSA